MASDSAPHFLTLPPEIREQVYHLLLNPDASRLSHPDEYTDYNYRNALVLFRLNRQIYYEARKVFRDLNIFVRIQTPFPNAQDYVAFEGHVPILMKGQPAARFQGQSLNVVIGAPDTPIQEAEPNYIVILLDDLEKFAKIWLYSDLTNPGLNRFLSLELDMRDPYTPDWEEKRMPKWVQRQLLMPFGDVKNLKSLTIKGDPKPLASIETELRAQQQIPYPTAEQCLSECARLKTEGNKELTAGNYHTALRLYAQAWEAMFIIVKGRQRHVHAEAYFSRELHDEPYKGRHGQAERLQLRVQLVANTCLAYLKLEDWEELIFWGMRTIGMMQQATGANEHDISPEDEAMLGFPAAVQLGKIYYRTAMGYKALGVKDQAKKLLRVAKVYLPRDENVSRELAEFTLKLG
ncbi:hypothetical protein JX265_010707 [Neoarthrinium moseri]|uniref:Uncharacterized protein n=1 Tax=Neoarthrinium moseri TaxID=1658444 RepID=A0A9Q0AI67_9PEZI|nr:hypothetical protein JX266_003085 [Neoarthrinium moseri]KAI1858614.1 hypothetical protein JX265_010707 [Neoarthrinium moseri]